MSFRHDTPMFSLRPQTPNRQLRNRSSLAPAFKFTTCFPVPEENEITESYDLYHSIIDDCETAGIQFQSPTADDHDGDISPHATAKDNEKLNDPPKGVVYLHDFFRALHRHSPTDAGRINLVGMILYGLFSPHLAASINQPFIYILPWARRWRTFSFRKRQETYATLAAIAIDFLEAFFIPLIAHSCNATSVSITHHLCLIRDGYRCVMSGNIDKGHHARKRKARGTSLAPFGVRLKTTHIIEYPFESVTALGSDNFALQIFDMFDPGISQELKADLADEDKTENTIVLAAELRDEFNKFRCYMEEVPGRSNTYTVKTTRDATPLLPIFRQKEQVTLENHEPAGVERAELPCPRLLRFHAACCKMMEMAAAAGYVETVLYEMERLMVEETLAHDGSSDFGMVMRIKGL